MIIIGKKKTIFVWILLVLMAVVVLFLAYSVVSSINTGGSMLGGLTWLYFVELAVLLVSISLYSIYVFKLYSVKKDVILWTHIVFGYTILRYLGSQVFTSLLSGYNTFALIAYPSYAFVFFGNILIPALMWVGIWLHLSRAKRLNLMDFS